MSKSHQRWAGFMYSDLQRERSLASWNVFGSSRRWGLDRRPDLEWRLIARCHQSHKQPKLYLDAVGCPPGAVLAVQPQSISHPTCIASLLHTHRLSISQYSHLLKDSKAALPPQSAHVCTGAESAAPSAALASIISSSQAFYLKLALINLNPKSKIPINDKPSSRSLGPLQPWS